MAGLSDGKVVNIGETTINSKLVKLKIIKPGIV